jgi:hypothetical protein
VFSTWLSPPGAMSSASPLRIKLPRRHAWS